MTDETQERRKGRSRIGLPDGVKSVCRRLLVPVCAMVAGGLGLAALLGWALGLPFLAGLGPEKMPMAPSTAMLFALYGVTIFLRSQLTTSSGVYWTGFFVHAAGALIALLLGVLAYLGIHPEVEHLGISILHTPGLAPAGHMSPVTALCFLLATLSFLASLPASPAPARPWRAFAASLPACLLLAISSPLVMASLFGMTLLYGGALISPSLPGSLAFVALGAALLSLAWPHARQSLRQAEPATRFPYDLIVVFIILVMGILAAGYLFYRGYERRCRIEVEHQLSAVAELKVAELVKWRGERLGDAGIIYQNIIFSTLISHYLNDREDSEAERPLREWIGQYTEHYEYDQVRLLDPDGVTRLSVPAGRPPASAAVLQGLTEVLRTGRVTIVDFYRHDQDQRIYLSVLTPILDASAGNRVIAVLSLQVDPERYLYPLILRWPTPSQTAETLLVRREGAEVLFLNNLKFRKEAALTPRVSLKRTDAPPVMAALGRTGIVEGLAYRGEVPVIADVRPVPDSPWFLVVSMNTLEVYAPAREHLWMILGLMTALIFGTCAGLAFVWRQQNLGFYRERLAAAEVLGKSEKKLSVLNRIAEIFLLVTDEDMYGQVLDVMRNVTGSQYGVFAYLDQEGAMVAPSMTRDIWEQCRIPQKSIRFPRETWGDSIWGRAILEKRSLNKNAPGRVPEGHVPLDNALVVPILFHGVVIGLFMLANRPGGYGQAEQNQVEELCNHIAPVLKSRLSRDRQQAARKQAEEKIRESEKRLRYAQQIAGLGFWDWNIVTGDLYWSDQTYIHYGFKPQEFVPTFDKFCSIVHPDDLAFVQQHVDASLQDDAEYDVEFRFVRPNGEMRYLYTRGDVTRDANGKAVRFVGSQIDITERKQAAEALLLSRNQMEAVAQIGAMANSTLDIGEVLSHILMGTLKTSGASVGMIFLRDQETGCLQWGASHGLPEAFVEAYQAQVIKPGEGLTGLIAQTGETVYIPEDSSHDPRIARPVIKAEGLHSFIGVPVYAEDKIVAVMNILTRPPDVLGEEKIALIKAVGTHVGFAIRNARLFKERRQVEEALLRSHDELELRVEERTAELTKVNETLHNEITERKQAEEALRESESRYRSLFSEAIDGICLADPETGVIIDCNQALEALVGRDRVELIGQHQAILHPPAGDKKGFSPTFEQHLTNKNGQVLETQIITRTGEIREVEIKANLLYLPEGKVLQGIFSDITDRKRAEEALRESEEKFRSLAESSTDYIMRYDRQCQHTYINPAGLKVAGIKESDIIGKTHRESGYPEDLCHLWEEKIQLVFETGKPCQVEFEFNSALGLVVLDWRLTPEFDAKGAVNSVLGVSRDITDRKLAEEQLLRSLKEKEVLLKEIHHRVKNNMQVIHSLLNLQAKGIADSKVRAMFEVSRDRVRSMALIHEKLYRAKDLAHIDFKTYLESFLQGIADSYQRDEVVLSVDMESIALDVNVGIPCGLIVNELISNSFKHAFPEGRKGVIRVGLNKNSAGNYVLTVEDNGIGLPVDVDMRNSPSLGLQLVNMLTEQLRGTLELSRSDWTRYSITFPGENDNKGEA